MSTSSRGDSETEKLNEISILLEQRLDEARQRNPDRFTKTVLVLPPVDQRKTNALQERLQEAKTNASGEHITLIPYSIKREHWIGIIMKFNVVGQLQRAEYCDPVTDSTFDPTMICQQFSSVFPSSTLLKTSRKEHQDFELSGKLTIVNLLAATEELSSKDSATWDQTKDPIRSGNHQGPFSAKTGSNFETDHNVTAISLPGSWDVSSKIRDSEREFLDSRNDRTHDRCESDRVEQSKTMNHDLKHDTEAREGRNHPSTTTKFSVSTGTDNAGPDEYLALKAALASRFHDNDLADESELKERIESKKRDIESLEKANKRREAQKRQNTLLELDEIQILADKVKVLAPKPVLEASKNISESEEYLALKAALASRLHDNDLADESELKERIESKKRDIQSLEKANKHKEAQKRKNSLLQLQEINTIVDGMRRITPSNEVDIGLMKKSDGETPRISGNVVRDMTPAFRSEPNEKSKNTDKFHSGAASTSDGENPTPPGTNVVDKESELLDSVEALKDLQSDLKTLPICAEKHLLNLFLFTSIRMISTSRLADSKLTIPQDIDTKLMDELELLQKRLSIEEIRIPWIKTALSSCESYFKSGNLEPALKELKKILKSLCPINMQELRRLVDKVDDAAKLIKDRDIILLIGGTGAGKSTTIHFLGGSTMIETKVKGMNHIAPIQVKNRDLQMIATAPSATSITRYIAPVTINLKQIGHRSNSTVILCDSPGFEDTSGPEVDIANGIGIVKAIRGCRSVKPVVLVSYKSMGDRCTGIKDLAHTLVGLMPGIQDHMKAFTYLFTKFSAKERDAIHATLIDVENHLREDEKSDISFTSILADMIKKTRKRAKAIDPVKDDPLDIMEDLIESTAIQHPEEVFHFSVSEKSKSSVQEQVRANQIAIIAATKRSDHACIQFKLDQLMYLHDLLQQDYIKQIYNDSITFASKHFIEQYHTATTTFQRCVINQTTLSKEEIQQYQTSIMHAKDADELKNKHLTQDVPHSSAYLQCVDQLIQTLSDDLKERDIDEAIVKVSLGKMKLLTTYFVHVQTFYHQTIAVFTQKLKSVADDAKKSVFDKKFDETAKHLKTLHGAISSLSDHLDREKLETVYAERKSVLVKYLTDSTAKFDHSFDKKLEKNDIDNLNHCVCMIETAEKTFALHTHVSQDRILQIRETLFIKILNHFNEIVDRIGSQIKKKTGLTVMEQLMSQLDAIRTISGFDILTTQSYFSTLEQVIGYINECRRDAEKLLDSLFKQEPVDFTRLVDSLAALQGAEWIETYRKGVHADLISTVERCILEQIEQLTKIVMQTNLDLERTEKIRDVYQVITRVDEMKRLNRFFPSITEPVDRVHKWFIKVTDDVFASLSSAFNIEKLKESECLALDFSKAEKGLQYLFVCKDIPLLFESRCGSTLSSLDDFLRRFSAEIQSEIATRFEKIKLYRLSSETDTSSPKETSSEDDIYDRARGMASRLSELSEIQTKHKLVFSYFINQRIVDEWKSALSDYHIELQDEMGVMSRTSRVEELNARLSIAKALSKLDGFIRDRQFIDLYKQYQDVFFSNTDDVSRKAIEAINRNDYDLVANEMAALQRADKIGEHFLKQARRAINFGVSTLMEEVKNKAIMLGHDVEREQISTIVGDLKKLQKAKQFISEYIDTPEDIDTCIKEVREMIADRMNRFLEGVKASITVNNFSEADRKIDFITQTRNLLGVYCAEDVAKNITELKTSQSNLVSTVLVSKYKDTDISDYTLNPPTDIFAKFAEVKHTNSIYNEASNAIRNVILAKFRQELASANSLEPPSTDNVHIRKFESAVKYLPEDMRKSLEEELKYCKENVTKLLEAQNQHVKNTLASGDLKAIKDILEEYQKSDGMKMYFNQVRDYLLTKTKEIARKIQECFEKRDISTALENVKLMHDYQVEFQKLVPDIKQQCSDVRQQVNKVFEEAYLYFLNTFVEKEISITSKDAVKMVEIKFADLFCFTKFSCNYRDLSTLSEMLPEDFHLKVASLHEKLASSSSRSEKQYGDALQSLDISSLKKSLEAADLWSSLIVKIIDSYTAQHIHDDSTKDLIRAMNELTRFEKMTKAVDDKLENLRCEIMEQELIKDETKEFGKRRGDFYAKLNEKFVILISAKELSTYSKKFDAEKAQRECLVSFERKIQLISDAANKIFQHFMDSATLSRIDYDQFNLLYNNLLSCRKEMTILKSDTTSRIETFEQQIKTKIEKWRGKIYQETNIDACAKVLIEMKSAANNLPMFKSQIEQEIDTILAQIKSDQTNKTAFGKLGVLLNQDRTGVGQSIVAEHKAFQGYSLSLFNEKTQRHGIDYVLEKLKGDDIDKDKLRKRYDEFFKIYEQLIKQYLKSEMNLKPLIATTKTIAGDVKQQKNEIEWDASIRNQVPQLAAHIFALWTLQSAHHYFETTETDKKESYLLKPHAAQIISIFRMLGIGDAEEKLSNNLVQIGTGEGKSVTLGATATLLALLGFDVCCACYSEYLSDRDYRSFLPLFESLGVEGHIHYGTFNKLCEYILNEDGDIRQVVEQLISTDQNQAVANAKQVKRAKILLIDEVDVFFSRDFYGNIYTPSASLRDPTITALVNHIWTNRKTKITLKKVQETEEYKNCRARFPKWDGLIQEAIKDMIADVTSFESHNYVVKDDKIGYIEQDSVVFNVVYGYKTLFAYFLEHERKKISPQRLYEKISITIKCGGYSYAETPLEFQYIMGVTGTLETLSEPEKEVIKTMYNIKKQTISPSVFGQNNLQFTKKEDIRVETSADYYNVIKREIDDRVKAKPYQRAVLVFFESEKKLRDFHTSDAMKHTQETVAILTEEASPSEKESIIKRVTASGQVTLFTKAFGRGTDFICHDPSVASNGGIHVIQTFLSEQMSEEVQIKGRTARQGDYGSYSMILLEEDLEKFQISPADLKDVRDGKPVFARAFYKVTHAVGLSDKCESVYDLLNKRRMIFFKTQYKANMEYVKAARVRHHEGQNFLTSLKSDDTEIVNKFLIEENKGAPETCNSRTVCLMDATGSMSHLLQKAKNTVGVMFDRAADVLKDNGISTDCFQLQFVVYRNYCCKEDKILQHSPWETKSDNLRAFMNTIDVKGGWGNEAIEIGLLHANEENERDEITQIILIGDAPPNTKTEVAQKRQRRGEDYWKKTKFARATCYEDELNKLKMKKVPVHAFYVDDQAKESFEGIANETGGRCEFLDINSPSGSDMLTNLVTEEILRSVGGSDKGTKLVDAYKAKFARSYIT